MEVYDCCKQLPQTNCSLVAAPAMWRLSALQTEISRVWSRSATGGFGVGSTDERDTSCATRLGYSRLGWRHVLRLYGAARSAGPLEPALRLQLWQRVFSRSFPWVWASIIVLF